MTIKEKVWAEPVDNVDLLSKQIIEVRGKLKYELLYSITREPKR